MIVRNDAMRPGKEKDVQSSPDELIHIRVGKELKTQMQQLIDMGMFTNQSEIAREGIRHLILRYRKPKDGDEP